MKTLNFGSLNLDYVYRVDRFVQPGETKACKSASVMAGGKGLNQSIAMAAAGMEVYHAGCIGPDAALLTDTLCAGGVRTELLQALAQRTGHAVIQVDGEGENCILLSRGTNGMLTEAYVDAVLGRFSRGDMVVLQNETNLVPYIIQTAHARGLKIALTVAPIDEAVREYPLALVDWLFVNRMEGSFLSGETETEAIAQTLANMYPHSGVVLTLGKDGSLCRVSGQVFHRPAFAVQAVDTTAAGDTFAGYFLAGVGEKMEVARALELGSAAAAICVMSAGAAQSIPERGRVDAFLSEREHI